MKPLALALGLLAASLGAPANEAVVFPGDGAELGGRLYRPPGRGPFPAVVLLHGCSGMWTRNGEVNRSYDHWARHLRDRGFVAVLMDSFGPRGEREICTHRERRIQPHRERTLDAYAALRWLAGRPDVDAARIHLLGWSNGATTALYAVRDRPAGISPPPRFRSAVAFYPGCRPLAAVEYRPMVPVLIQAGEADDWTPAAHCLALAERGRLMGDPVSIDVHPGAHHAFDGIAGAVRFRPDVRNPTSPQGLGATVGPNPRAREKAWEAVLRFLESPPVPRGTGAATPSIP